LYYKSGMAEFLVACGVQPFRESAVGDQGAHFSTEQKNPLYHLKSLLILKSTPQGVALASLVLAMLRAKKSHLCQGQKSLTQCWKVQNLVTLFPFESTTPFTPKMWSDYRDVLFESEKCAVEEAVKSLVNHSVSESQNGRQAVGILNAAQSTAFDAQHIFARLRHFPESAIVARALNVESAAAVAHMDRALWSASLFVSAEVGSNMQPVLNKLLSKVSLHESVKSSLLSFSVEVYMRKVRPAYIDWCESLQSAMDLAAEKESTPKVITHGWASLGKDVGLRWEGRKPYAESIRAAVCATVVHSNKKSPGLAHAVLGCRQHWSSTESQSSAAVVGAFKGQQKSCTCPECITPTDGSLKGRPDLEKLMESVYVSKVPGVSMWQGGEKEVGLMMPTEVGQKVHVSDLGSDVGTAFSYLTVGAGGIVAPQTVAAQHTPQVLNVNQRAAMSEVMLIRRKKESAASAAADESNSDTATVIHTPAAACAAAGAAAPAQPSAAQPSAHESASASGTQRSTREAAADYVWPGFRSDGSGRANWG
jgi:hypothetical protein